METESRAEVLNTQDPIERTLRNYAENILVIIFGLLPLLFIPTPAAPFEFSKTFLALIGVLAALVLYTLSILRGGKATIGFPYALVALWGVVLVAFLSTILSGDIRDSLMGNQLSVHSTTFVVILALTASIWTVMHVKKSSVMRLYILFSVSTMILVLFHIARLIFGAQFLSFGIFQNAVSSPIGSWNDLAIFLGLIVLLSLVTLEQLDLTKRGRVLFTVVGVLALGMLAVINFTAVWVILGLVSLSVLVYTLTKDRFSSAQNPLGIEKASRSSSLLLSLIVSAVSIVFILGGPFLSGMITTYTDISYLEVRPSLSATADIARGVYGENAFLGIGTNKFSDAWRLYKDDAINTTVFWNTSFNAGSGYIPTFFVTTGVLGALAWVFFFGVFVYSGIRMLMNASNADRMWYFIGVSAFASALYVWILAVLYVPGAVILLIGAVCTGLTFVARHALQPNLTRTFNIGANRRTGFIFTLAVIIVIIGSVSSLYGMSKYYAAEYTFNHALQSVRDGLDIAITEAAVARAYELFENDTYARQVAGYQLARINSLLALPEPNEAQQQQFQNAFVNGVNSAQQATVKDASEPENWAVLGDIYSILTSLNIEGSYDRAREALTKARDLDPKNPLRYLALAQLEARSGNLDGSRAFTEEAVRLKSNYSDALFFLSQLDIASGNVAGAVETTRSMIALEPQNPTRYYQLGVLESAQGNVEIAVAAFERAVAFDPNYANALYFLALGYDALGRSEEARVLLAHVLELNPGNTSVIELINAIDTGGSLGQAGIVTTGGQPVQEGESVSEENGIVTTTEAPDTSLITPVNTAPSSGEGPGKVESDPGAEI